MRAFDKRAFNLVTAFLGLWAIQLASGITVRNPLTVVLFVCLFLLKEKLDEYSFDGAKCRLFGVISLIHWLPEKDRCMLGR